MNRSPLAAGLLRCAALAAALAATAAGAEPEPAVGVAVDEGTPPQRTFAISWNPAAFLVGRLSLDLVVVPVEHHGLVLSPFLASATTSPIWIYDDHGVPTQLPVQTFRGGGVELGYRHYSGSGGPTGLFLGPSLILGWFTAKAQDGSETSYLRYGLAADAGYQILVADRVSLALGAGVQYTATSKPIPPQQYPANLYASSSVLPRVLASLGLAF